MQNSPKDHNPMSSRLCKSIIFSVLALTVLAAYGGDRGRVFPCERSPLRGDLLSASVWDFSGQWLATDRGRSNVRVYGDSLLAETVNGRRCWYEISADSILYVSEEDRLTSLKTDSAVFSSPRPVAPGFSSSAAYSSAGLGSGRRFAIIGHGTLSFDSSPGRGLFIPASGDTLRGITVTRERRKFTATFPDDTTSLPVECLVETYRWYDSDGLSSLLPLALQRTVRYGAEEDAEPAYSMALLPDRNGYNGENESGKADSEMPVDPEAAAKALREASVTCDGRTVSVNIALPQDGLTVAVDIIDASGRLYLHQTSTSGSLTVDCSSLRQGEYIAAVSVENVATAPEKRLVLIR